MSNIEIYIGNPIEHKSDKIVLKHMVSVLDDLKKPAIIFANISLEGRQIDFVLILDGSVIVFEAKESMLPLEGGENGLWHVIMPSGKKNNIRNFYTQTLEASYAFKNNAEKFFNLKIQYPKAVLVFCNKILNRSNIRTDFKVSVIDLPDIQKLLRENNSTTSINNDRWGSFAKKNKFIKVNSLESALDQDIFDSELIIKNYLFEFEAYYKEDLKGFIEFSCNKEEKKLSSSDLNCFLDKNLLIYGPSGCGKSLLVKSLALRSEKDAIPIFLEAKYFDGNFNKLFQKELSLTNSSFKRFFSAYKKLNLKLLLIIDGFNECKEDEKRNLARCANIFSDRFGATVIITSQINERIFASLTPNVISVPPPDINLKLELAKFSAKNSVTGNSFTRLLESVNTCLEACIIGELGNDAKSDSSQFILFDNYTRKRLGSNAQEGIKLLAEVAHYLSTNITFSLSIRDYDRLIRDKYPTYISKILFKLNFLRSTKDRISFSHEMFFRVFRIESIISGIRSNSDSLFFALSMPQLDYLSQELFLGSIEDIKILHNVLEKLGNSRLIESCIKGRCGHYAKEFTQDCVSNIIKRIKEEITSLDFIFDERALHKVKIKENANCKWNKGDHAYISVLSSLLSEGSYLDEIYDIAGYADIRMSEIFNFFFEDAKKQEIKLRNGIFAETISNQNSSIALARLLSRISFSLFSKNKDVDFISKWINKKASRKDISNAQFYMIYEISRNCRDSVNIIPVVLDFIQNRWKSTPHSLKLEILDAIVFCGPITEEENKLLIEVLEDIDTNKEGIMISTFIVDALKSLGSLELDSSNYQYTVESELQDLFAKPDGQKSWNLAKILYDSQFDHPYDIAYWNAIHELSDEKRKKFLAMVVRADSEFMMFLSCAITDLASFKDPNVGKYIERWTSTLTIQKENTVFTGDPTTVFVTAHIILGYLKYPILSKEYGKLNLVFDDVFLACGEIYYWLNRHDLNKEEKYQKLDKAWNILNNDNNNVAAGVIMECDNSLKNSDTPRHLSKIYGVEINTILKGFNMQALEVYRQALINRSAQVARVPMSNVAEILSYSISVLGSFGQMKDIVLLKGMIDDDLFIAKSTEAIKKIEERTL